jgi:hypothetical protein
LATEQFEPILIAIGVLNEMSIAYAIGGPIASWELLQRAIAEAQS